MKRDLFSRRRAALWAVLALTAAGCSAASTAPGPDAEAPLDATAPSPDETGMPAAQDGGSSEPGSGMHEGDSSETGQGTEAGLDATPVDDGSFDAATADASQDASHDAGADASGPDAGRSGSDAGQTGSDAGDAAQSTSDAAADAAQELDAAAEADAAPDAAGGPDAGTPTFTSIYVDIISPNCLNCHSQPLPSDSNLYMGTQQDAYSDLVNVTAAGEACGVPLFDGAALPIRVIPGDAADSLLYLKITNTQHCGSGMPLDSDPLSAGQILAIKTWIDQGAAND
jgi:hypothetical protein